MESSRASTSESSKTPEFVKPKTPAPKKGVENKTVTGPKKPVTSAKKPALAKKDGALIAKNTTFFAIGIIL